MSYSALSPATQHGGVARVHAQENTTYLNYRPMANGVSQPYTTYNDPEVFSQATALVPYTSRSDHDASSGADDHATLLDWETQVVTQPSKQAIQHATSSVARTKDESQPWLNDSSVVHKQDRDSIERPRESSSPSRYRGMALEDVLVADRTNDLASEVGDSLDIMTESASRQRRLEAHGQMHDELKTSADYRPHTATTQSSDNPEGSPFGADPRTLSQRVRSMYEDDADLEARLRPVSALSGSSRMTGEGSPYRARGTLSPDYGTMANGASSIARSASAMSSRSRVSRGPDEAAGGVEDWTDVASSDVDRYGFIRTPAVRSKYAALNPVQRPYTPLSAIDEASPPSGTLNGQPSNQSSTIVVPSKPASTRPAQTDHSPRTRIRAFDFLRSPRRRQKYLLAEADKIIPSSLDVTESSNPLVNSNTSRARLESARASKWQAMTRALPSSSPRLSAIGGGTLFGFNPSDPKVISRTWKGIPDRWRATAWHSFLSVSATRNSPTRCPSPSDADLIFRFHALQDVDYVEDGQIDIDVPRTVGQHVMFRKRYRGGQRLLFRVCHALALYFPDVGYVQGMGSLVATLICYFDEEQAFVAAVRMWQHRGIGWLYKNGFGGLMSTLR